MCFQNNCCFNLACFVLYIPPSSILTTDQVVGNIFGPLFDNIVGDVFDQIFGQLFDIVVARMFGQVLHKTKQINAALQVLRDRLLKA